MRRPGYSGPGPAPFSTVRGRSMSGWRRRIRDMGTRRGRGATSRAHRKSAVTTSAICCSVCGLAKPLSEFGVDRHAATGHRADCRECVNARARWRRANPANPTPRQAEQRLLANAGLRHCRRCGRDLPVEQFYADASRSDGRFPYCADCTKKNVASYMADPAYRERRRQAARETYYANAEKFQQRHADYYQRNRLARLAASKVQHELNRETDNARVREWYRRNAEHVAAYQRRYKVEHRDLVRSRDRKRQGWRRRNDSRYAIDHRMARALSHALGPRKSGSSWQVLLGYSLDGLMSRLEQQFSDGMTWENCGEWHIDHIIPRASFAYLGPHEPAFRVCWSLWNLRPLWGADNLRKSRSLPRLDQVPEPLRELIAAEGLPGFEWLFDEE